MKEGLELAGVEVTPHPGLGMIPTSQLAATGRTAPADAGSMLNMDVHSASRRVQLDVTNKPRVAQPQNPRIQVRVLHGHPPGRTISGHLPTEKSEGPFSQRRSRRRHQSVYARCCLQLQKVDAQADASFCLHTILAV